MFSRRVIAKAVIYISIFLTNKVISSYSRTSRSVQIIFFSVSVEGGMDRECC